MATEEHPADPAQVAACSPCRGTGRVVSSLGGEQTLVTCPWCEGGGVQIAGHDAQAARRAAAAEAGGS